MEPVTELEKIDKLAAEAFANWFRRMKYAHVFTYKHISTKTGIAVSTLHDLANARKNRISMGVSLILIEFFEAPNEYCLAKAIESLMKHVTDRENL